MKYLNYLSLPNHLNPTGDLHPEQKTWQEAMTDQERPVLGRYLDLYYELVLSSAGIYDRKSRITQIKETLRELRRLMVEGTEGDEERRARGLRICDQNEGKAMNRFGFNLDGKEKRSDDEIRAEARADELRKKGQGPVFGPPRPPGMT